MLTLSIFGIRRIAIRLQFAPEVLQKFLRACPQPARPPFKQPIPARPAMCPEITLSAFIFHVWGHSGQAVKSGIPSSSSRFFVLTTFIQSF